MKKTTCLLAFVFALPVYATDPAPASSVIVHEWGTFTSVAGANGEAVSWAPLAATADLPCFVHKLGKGLVKFSTGLVRMETPVVYFYSKAPAAVSVHVGFPEGWITEWYPRATHVFPDNPEPYGIAPGGGALYSPKLGSIDWADLVIRPGADDALPSTKNPSRYFAARATDSAMLQSGDENEKLLFYRGIANFSVPLVAFPDATGVKLGAPNTLPLAILFENQSGRIGYRIMRNVRELSHLDAPALGADPRQLRTDLVEALERAGLYPKEAAAMVETWHDSWFEEGMRVIYLLPRTMVDRLLPLSVSPTPKGTQRVFVGRVEILSPWTQRTLRSAMETGDVATLSRFGRFVPPFLAQMKAWGGLVEAPAAAGWVRQMQESLLGNGGAASCVQ